MGILAINKAKNMTSHDVVAILRKKLGTKKVGHTGTLDPIATGVLPMCIGRATKLSQYVSDLGKAYIADLEFGKETSTYDCEGEVINISDKQIFTKEEINKELNKFKGEISQVPPIYSAIKVDGKKLYEYAREGKKVEIKARKVTIHDIKLLDLNANRAKIYVDCSKGTYIRSLIHDLGRNLGTYAFMTDLQRIKVGNLSIEQTIDISDIDKYSKEDLYNLIIKPEEVLDTLPSFDVDDNIRFRLINGQRVNVKDIKKSEKIQENTLTLVFNNNNFLGLAMKNDNIFKMEKLIWQE
ncbi:tRNA pseudouridine(55) synthase TruB [uncultured Helcococcus sp.]|uniref:tRNA pseudouridine(55) synthase TruB n=1 Tax=uncultured Helcococcus sp. TaxID=1072508 RepID=UPI002889DB92|nr:tRNA pseudouridine(55) synthase TruB [uncultured Helcococcus sp.]